jgi:hypothetical protein
MAMAPYGNLVMLTKEQVIALMRHLAATCRKDADSNVDHAWSRGYFEGRAAAFEFIAEFVVPFSR